MRSAERDSFPVARQYGVGVLSYGPLAAGWLSGKYRVGGEQPESARADLIPGRFDITLAQNQRKLHAAEELATLAQKYELSLVQLAVAFALTHPAVSSVIVGPRTPEHLSSYLAAVATTLEEDLLDAIDDIVVPGSHFVERDTGRDLPALTRAERRRSTTGQSPTY